MPKKPPPHPEATLQRALAKMSPWPATWRIVEKDVSYGERLLKELIAFVTHLVTQEQLAARTIGRHLGYL